MYWITTTLVSLFLAWSAYSYLFSEATIRGIQELGFPGFFRLQLAVLKILAILVLLLPHIPLYVKDWAYAGVALFFITAMVAHFAHKDPLFINLLNLVMLGLLIASRIGLQKMLQT
ncbi:MAG: DoxX family protein [Bacteroidota bacterium]